MNDRVIELAEQAKRLEAEDRLRLAELLLDSVQQEPEPEVDVAWSQEIARRLQEIESGTVALIPAAEVFAKARRAPR